MLISILNGDPAVDGSELNAHVAELQRLLKGLGHEVDTLRLRELDLRYCEGCWGCWVKTPGECVQDDDGVLVCRASIRSDLLIFASPIVMGFTSALLKKACDRMVPLVHPYMVVENREVQHLGRYHKYPAFGLLLDKSPDADDRDIEIIQAIYARIARNLKTTVRFVRLTTDPVEGVADEVNRL